MNQPISPLRTRLAALRKNPAIAALAVMGPGGQVFELVGELVDQVERQAQRIEQLERQLAGLGALRVNPIGG